MRLKMTDLQRFARKAIDEENSSLELRNEIKRVLGPRSLVDGTISDVVQFANECIDILEYSGRRPHELGFKVSIVRECALHRDPEVRKFAARVLPESMIGKFELDASAAVRRVAAKRLPTAVVRRMSKRFPPDSVIRECLHNRVLSEAGMATPKAGEEHRMYHDERLGDSVKQAEGPELSDVWYEAQARRFLQDYGRMLGQDWEENAVKRFCSSTKATSGVEVDEERLLDAVNELIEEREEEVLEKSSLKEVAQRLRAESELEERRSFIRNVNAIETPNRHLRRARTLMNEAIMAPRDELMAQIAAMEPREVAADDYADVDTGEVYLEAGKEARTSEFHPDYVKPPRKLPPNPFSSASDDDDDVVNDEDAWDAYQMALEEFASGWEGLGHDPSEAADAAEGFFANYAEWKSWAKELGMSRKEMKSDVIDAVVEAMGR